MEINRFLVIILVQYRCVVSCVLKMDFLTELNDGEVFFSHNYDLIW